MREAWALALHGGAGRAHPSLEAEAHMRALLELGAGKLEAGEPALDVVEAMVHELEASGHHVAGKGAHPNAAGVWELDASIIDGRTKRAGAVAALQGFASPIQVARLVMERTPHVLLAGAGAARFAEGQNCTRIEDPIAYYQPRPSLEAPPGSAKGTVGAVAKDKAGRLAAATSTGGLRDKLPGRVGDSPLLGAGTWADESCAVSCTGWGEMFIRANAAAEVSARLRLVGQSLEQATIAVLAEVQRLGGDGGLIAVDRDGRLTAPFNSRTMKRGLALASGRRDVIFGE
jgi:isoaspartyl peptidase/L-asparaginase-like protein (Ntn-hydrolase superfamily)